MKLLVFAGSTRQNSLNRKLATVVADHGSLGRRRGHAP